jgi:hypothetical protein
LKTLRNDEDRKLYIENPNNWSVLREQNPFRVALLKNTPFVKLDIWTAAGWSFVGYFKTTKADVPRPNTYHTVVELSRHQVKYTEIVRYLKKTKI